MNKTKVAPKIKPLTKRQLDVLCQIAFGEVSIVPEYITGRAYTKARDRLDVDVSSVVRVLRKYKMVRKFTYQQPPEQLPNGVTEHYYPFDYLTLTPDGYAEIEKHPHLWNE